MQAIFETVFDTVYLTTVIFLGVKMLRESRDEADGKHGGWRQFFLFGLMAVVLGAGDSFHLIPRAVALCSTGLESYRAALGIGKLVTSMTMTVFYVILYYVWRERYQVQGAKGLTALVWGLAALRWVLCLLPQNRWTAAVPPLSWGIYRNIPFTILGILLAVLLYRSARECRDHDFRNLWLSIVISFACYLPVVLLAEKIPIVGMLMIPKTCAYVWTVLIGYTTMKRTQKL